MSATGSFLSGRHRTPFGYQAPPAEQKVRSDAVSPGARLSSTMHSF